MDNLKSKGYKALIWDFFGKIASQGMGFIVTIFLARLLEPADFGLIALIMVVIGMAQVFTDVGLGAALIQRKDVTQAHYSSVFFFNVGIALCLSLLTYFCAPFIASFYNNLQLISLIEVASLLFVINALNSVQQVKLRKKLNYALLTKVNLIASLVSGVVGVSLAFLDAGVWSLLAQILLFGVVTNILLWTTSNWRPELKFSWQALTQLWGFGFRMFLAGLLDAIYTRLDFLIIGKLFPIEILGYFQRAKQFNLLVIQYTSGSLMSVLFPVLSQVKDDLPRFQKIVIKTLHILCFIVFMLLGGLYLLSEELIVFLFSEKWLPSVNYMELLLLSGFAYPLSALLVNVLSSRGDSKTFLKLEIIKKSIHTVNFINVIYFGIEAYLYGLVLVAFIGVSLNVYYVAKEIELKLRVFFQPILIQLVICCVSVYVTFLIIESYDLSYLYSFFSKGSLFVILFFSFNIIFKIESFKITYKEVSPSIIKYYQRIKRV